MGADYDILNDPLHKHYNTIEKVEGTIELYNAFAIKINEILHNGTAD